MLKDALRTGRWRIGQSDNGESIFWEVTPQVLATLASEFRRAKANGVRVNLVWGHGDVSTGVVDPRDLIAPIEDVFVVGNVLWVSARVSADDAHRLRNPACAVSVRVIENWTDGAGRNYSLMLLHVAVVDQPVVTRQQPFRDFSNTSRYRSRPLDYEPLVKAINSLLTPWHLSLPTDVNEQSLQTELDLLVAEVMRLAAARAAADSDLNSFDEHAEDAAESTQPTDAALSNQSAGKQNGSNAISRGNVNNDHIAATVRQLAHQIAELQRESSRSRFLQRLHDLAASGHISARLRQELQNTGERTGFDLSLLQPFATAGLIPMGEETRRFATGAPPRGAVGSTDLTNDELQEAAAALGGRFVATAARRS